MAEDINRVSVLTDVCLDSERLVTVARQTITQRLASQNSTGKVFLQGFF
jgi:hypothetical protein